jgi:DNA (cytosine-5)-methyltransferase 1
VAKGYFKMILKELKDSGYLVQVRLIDAQWLGVPQSRQRLIFMGVRNDLKLSPRFPIQLRYRYSVREAIPWLADLRFTPHGPNSFDVPKDPMDRPAPSVLAQAEGGTWARHDSEVYAPPIEGRAIEDTGGEWGMGDVTDRPAPTVRAGGVGHLVIETESDISRFAIGAEWDKLKPGEQSDKYFQLVKQDPDAPCQTVTAAGGNASIATVTHPFARRKFSIGELKRIGGFPDDFILTGTYQQQWERIGRAVPPVMMAHIARTAQQVLDEVHGVMRE